MLGGSLFTHNVDQFDYCFRESIASLLELCDEVVVLDAQSTDGTLPALREIASKNPKMKLVEGAVWDCGHKHERLAVLANQARSYLTTPWHFMLQADEVIHEDSFGIIRQVIAKHPNGHPFNTFAVRRFNLFGDFNHHISLHASYKPCNDTPIRLGLSNQPAIGDAESLMSDRLTHEYVNHIKTFHYGLVRKSEALMDKTIDMQAWFHSPEGVDKRVLAMKESGNFDPFKLIARSEISPLQSTHPKFMTDWIREREAEKIAHMA